MPEDIKDFVIWQQGLERRLEFDELSAKPPHTRPFHVALIGDLFIELLKDVQVIDSYALVIPLLTTK